VDGGEDWNKGICLTNGKNEVIPPRLTVQTFKGRSPLSDLALGMMLHAMGGLKDSFFTGDLAELIICSGPVPTDEDAALRNYLNSKYGIQ
jgi:hypothetical protein